MKRIKFIYVVFCLLAVPLSSFAQEFSSSDIILKTGKSPYEGRVHSISIENLYNGDVMVQLKNEYDHHDTPITLKKGEKRDIDLTFNVVFAKPVNAKNYTLISRYGAPAKDNKNDTTNTKKREVKQEAVVPKPINKQDSVINNKTVSLPNKADTIQIKKIISKFISVIDTIPFYSLICIKEDSTIIMNHVENLRNWNDKVAYIHEKGIEDYLKASRDTLENYRSNSISLIDSILGQYSGAIIADEEICIDSMKAILSARQNQREYTLQLLEAEIDSTSPNKTDWKLIIVCVATCILLFGLVFWYRKADRKYKKTNIKRIGISYISHSDKDGLLIDSQPTALTLKRQSLEDIYGNEAYLKIDCNDFCNDSAVKTLYIKNTCIKEIYFRYAENLRNPDRPKEDGCMVLGRWVLDNESNKYEVSLEYTVMPGDDAIFTEHELNFGGKIQNKKVNMLIRLRQDSDLQYDLTCWVHSHPNMGIFFSNSDNNVQTQLKHPTHPNFLTAIVVDICTPKQDLGIFTFQSNGIVNSKNDLTKLYSLEEMFQWALDSERRSFCKEDYFNTLSKTEMHLDECFGIELSNGAIIDMTYLTSSPSGNIGFVNGYVIKQENRMEYICSTVTKTETINDTEVIGCFVVATHCSIPSIRRVIGAFLDKAHFVLVYTTSDELLTSIPIINRDLCNDEHFYGEQSFEDLKIWTRRRR